MSSSKKQYPPPPLPLRIKKQPAPPPLPPKYVTIQRHDVPKVTTYVSVSKSTSHGSNTVQLDKKKCTSVTSWFQGGLNILRSTGDQSIKYSRLNK